MARIEQTNKWGQPIPRVSEEAIRKWLGVLAGGATDPAEVQAEAAGLLGGWDPADEEICHLRAAESLCGGRPLTHPERKRFAPLEGGALWLAVLYGMGEAMDALYPHGWRIRLGSGRPKATPWAWTPGAGISPEAEERWARKYADDFSE